MSMNMAGKESLLADRTTFDENGILKTAGAANAQTTCSRFFRT